MVGPESRIVQSIQKRIRSSDTSIAIDRIAQDFHDVSDFWSQWVGMVDDSPFSLEEWIAATDSILAWRRDRGLESDPARILGFLACCSEIAGELPGGLEVTVRLMLDRHGMIESLN